MNYLTADFDIQLIHMTGYNADTVIVKGAWSMGLIFTVSFIMSFYSLILCTVIFIILKMKET